MILKQAMSYVNNSCRVTHTEMKHITCMHAQLTADVGRATVGQAS